MDLKNVLKIYWFSLSLFSIISLTMLFAIKGENKEKEYSKLIGKCSTDYWIVEFYKDTFLADSSLKEDYVLKLSNSEKILKFSKMRGEEMKANELEVFDTDGTKVFNSLNPLENEVLKRYQKIADLSLIHI